MLNRDSNNKLTISSPLEGHKAETIVFSICGVDVGYENPIFALIELEYSESDQDPTGEAFREVEKKLSYYELDLGLNHVVRKWSEPISRTANLLLPVPGGDTWPSGVLICGENWVSYKHQGHVEIRAPLPRRHDLPVERGVLITAGTLHKQKDMFFYLLQSEYGDLYKVSLELSEDGKSVQDVVVAVFGSIPAATSLCITKSGFLFAACEAGNHLLLQFQGLDDPDAVRSHKIEDEELNEQLGDDSFSAAKVAPLFTATRKLQNFIVIDENPSLSPITDMVVDDILGEGAPQLYALCGNNNRSTLRTLRRGISVSEVAVSELPGRPAAVWTIKRSHEDEYDAYAIVSFSNATLVLSIGDTIEEVTDSGFLATTPTLQVSLFADNSMIQVYPYGIRHIRSAERVNEWKSPNKRTIQHATVNSRQIAVALSGGEIIYFEQDETGALDVVASVEMGKEVSCLDLGVVGEGEARSLFLAVGYWDDSCQLLTLDPRDVLARGPSFKLETRPSSISLVEMVKELPSNDEKKKSADLIKSLYLFIGEERGVLHRLSVDAVTGDFSDPRQKFLGAKAVKLCRIHIKSCYAVMALSARSWLSYNFQNKYHQDPLSYETLEHIHDFSSDTCPHGLVAVAGQSLRIISIENLGNTFNQQSMSLQFTPRRLVRIPNTTDIAIIETDHNEFVSADKPYNAMEMDADNEEEEEGTTVTIKGPTPALPNKWASGIRILDVATGTSKGFLELGNDEAAFSVTTVRFVQHSEEVFIAIGTAVALQLAPRKVAQCFINLYRNIDGSLQLLHKTEVEDVPYALIEFQGKLLTGIGKSLRLYDLGKKKLLKKCENKNLPNQIVRLQGHGDRIYVGDVSQSVLMVKYRRAENLFSVFADDAVPR
ncbi:hypothetical protein EON65_08340 [archaeon]|nr:MAG: hypothetical protein EON65_08340 [archaeon]